jgi:hypothetical protein
MRVLDMSHYWSTGTHSKYQGKLNVFRQFEVEFRVPNLPPTPLLCPPAGADIGLMWMVMESSSLHTTHLKDMDDLRPLLNATVWRCPNISPGTVGRNPERERAMRAHT